MSAEAATLRVYLAGPEVFLPDAARVLGRKASVVRAAGLDPLLPVDEQEALEHPGGDLAARIFAGNLRRLEACDLLIANLTPFRGSAADPGTVFELGYVAARGRPVLAYTADPRDLADRVGDTAVVDGVLRDADGLMVEAFSRADNLMPAIACERAGHPIVRVAADGTPAERIADIGGLEACLARVAASGSGAG